MAAAMAVANATRVRSDGVRRKTREMTFTWLLLPQDESHAPDGVQQS
jgi:hypothetical protein